MDVVILLAHDFSLGGLVSYYLWSSKPSTDLQRPVNAGEGSHGATPPATFVNVEGTTGGGVATVSRVDEAHAGDGAKSQQVAEPVVEVGGAGANAG